MDRLRDKVIVVTGASSGYGRGIATAAAAEGAKVVVSDIKPQPNAGGFDVQPEINTADLITSNGGEAIYVQTDMTDKAQVAALVKTAVDTYGKLDGFVNNVGIYRAGTLTHLIDEKDFDDCWNLNVKTTLFGAQESIKQFLEQGNGGSIVNMVSTAGLGGHPMQAAYNTSKGAQANLTRCLAVEYGHEQIRVNGICPTFGRTSMSRAIVDDTEMYESIRESFPLKRWAEIPDIASLAVFLLSDDSSFIHGVLHPIDGGETLSRYSV